MCPSRMRGLTLNAAACSCAVLALYERCVAAGLRDTLIPERETDEICVGEAIRLRMGSQRELFRATARSNFGVGIRVQFCRFGDRCCLDLLARNAEVARSL